MKKLILTLCLVLLSALVASPPVINHAAPAPDQALDSYGNICWEDEKARLDNFAIELQNSQETRGLIVVYAGSRSCAGEAQARAERAREWVVGRGVAADRVLWKAGGYLEQQRTWLWVVPSDLDEKRWPLLPSLEPWEFRIFSNCKGKIYKPVKCSKI
jgi:hypothetical protein